MLSFWVRQDFAQIAAADTWMHGCEGIVGQTLYGTFAKSKGKFWFIEQDSGEAKMFVMPHACGVFGDRPPELRMDGWTDGWRYRCICVCINMYTVVGGESGGELEWTSYGVINV